MTDKAAYHHGDLRAALLSSALSLMEESGVEQLSLRAVARRAGVSRGAPYHHFKNKEAMVAAVAAHGFEQVVHGMQAVDCADPQEALRRCGRAYLAFALENPTLYRLMFSEKAGERKAHPELKAQATCAFELLVQRLLAWRGTSATVDEEVLGWAMAVWGSVHGMASLLIDRLGPEEMHGAHAEAQWIDTLIGLVEGGLRGLASDGPSRQPAHDAGAAT